MTSGCLFLFFFFFFFAFCLNLLFCLSFVLNILKNALCQREILVASRWIATSLFTFAVCSCKCNAYCLVSYVLLFTSGRKPVFTCPCACLHRKLLVSCFEKKCTPRLCVNHGLATFIGTCGRRETQAERKVLLSGGALELAIGRSLTSTPRSEHPILYRLSTSRIPAKPERACFELSKNKERRLWFRGIFCIFLCFKERKEQIIVQRLKLASWRGNLLLLSRVATVAKVQGTFIRYSTGEHSKTVIICIAFVFFLMK